MGPCMSKTGMFANPQVSVKSIDCRGVSFKGVTIDATLAVFNPNPSTLRATGVRYRVSKASDGTELAAGLSTKEAVFSPMESTDMVVPVTFTYFGIGAAGMSLAKRGETTVVFSGDMTFDAPLTKEGKVSVPFKGEELIVIEQTGSSP